MSSIDHTDTHIGPAGGYDHPPGGFYARYGKSLFDFLLALLIVPVIAPVIILLWLLVRRDGGPGFFAHPRVGRNGKVFLCWKLRTMVPDAAAQLARLLEEDPDAAAQWDSERKLMNDPRITPLGDFLRRTSLDELPQIWNVLRGEMSFVGPRPVTRLELHKYGHARADYKALKPGITGLWQVSGRNSLSYDERVALDSAYGDLRSLRTDLRVLGLTVFAVLGKTGC